MPNAWPSNRATDVLVFATSPRSAPISFPSWSRNVLDLPAERPDLVAELVAHVLDLSPEFVARVAVLAPHVSDLPPEFVAQAVDPAAELEVAQLQLHADADDRQNQRDESDHIKPHRPKNLPLKVHQNALPLQPSAYGEAPDAHRCGVNRVPASSDYEPRRLPAGFLDEAIDDALDAGGLVDRRAFARAQREFYEGRRYFPPVTSLQVGSDGTIWLAGPDNHGGRTWLVLDGSGSSIGQVRLPTTSRVSYANRTDIWVVERDALDIPYVVRYEIVP